MNAEENLLRRILPFGMEEGPTAVKRRRVNIGIKTVKAWGSIFLLVFFLSGCATYYRVRLNGYLDTSPSSVSIKQGVSFSVLENKNAKNPIFETEVKSKIERLLRQKGFRISSNETADFYLGFAYTMSSGRRVSDTMPVYYPPETGTIRTHSSTGETSTSIVTYPGYTVYVPYKFTVYTSSLHLEVFDANHFRNTQEKKLIWIGEALNTSQNADLRQAINYLLVAAFQHFGENTLRSLVTNVSNSDPRIKSILQTGE